MGLEDQEAEVLGELHRAVVRFPADQDGQHRVVRVGVGQASGLVEELVDLPVVGIEPVTDVLDFDRDEDRSTRGRHILGIGSLGSLNAHAVMIKTQCHHVRVWRARRSLAVASRVGDLVIIGPD